MSESRDSYLHPAALELAALASFIRIGHIRAEDLRDSKLFAGVALLYKGAMQGYVQACRPVVLELAEAMEARKFVGSAVVRQNADNYVEAMVDGKLTAQSIRTFIVEYAHAPKGH